jgi:hypothetical protein
MIIGMRILSAANTTNPASAFSAAILPAGDSFAVVFSAASLTRYPTQPSEGTTDQAERDASIPTTGAQEKAQLISAQSDGSARPSAHQLIDTRQESVKHETSESQHKSNCKTGAPAAPQPSIVRANGAPDNAGPITQITAQKASIAQLPPAEAITTLAQKSSVPNQPAGDNFTGNLKAATFSRNPAQQTSSSTTTQLTEPSMAPQATAAQINALVISTSSKASGRASEFQAVVGRQVSIKQRTSESQDENNREADAPATPQYSNVRAKSASDGSAPITQIAISKTSDALPFPSEAATTALAPRLSATNQPAGDSFADSFKAASFNRNPGHQTSRFATTQQTEAQVTVGRSNSSAPTTQAATSKTSGALPIPSPATTTTVPKSSVPSQPAGVSIAGSFNAAAFNRYLDQQTSESAATQQTDPTVPTAVALPQTEAQDISPVRANRVPDSTVPAPQIAESNALVADSSRTTQGNDQFASGGYSEVNVQPANGQVCKVGSDTATQVHTKAASNSATPEANKTSQGLRALVTPLEAPDQDDSAPLIETIETPNIAAGAVESTAAATAPQLLPFPMLASLANQQVGIPASGNTTHEIGTAKSTSESQNPVNANPGTARTTESTYGGAYSQFTPSVVADSTQNSALTQRVVDIAISHPNPQTAVDQPISTKTTTAPHLTDVPGDASHFGSQRQGVPSIDAENIPSMAKSAISDARLVQTMNESEMRIGLSSNAFGDISIRTSISGHQLVAQISLDHSELSQAISAQVSSVQTKLGDEHGLHASIEISSHSSPQTGDAGGSSQRERGSSAAPFPTSSAVALAEEGSSLSQETVLNAVNETRLDIRA